MNQELSKGYFERVKAYLAQFLGVSNAIIELSSIRVSAVLTPDAGGLYSISLRHIHARTNVDRGVEDNNIFFGFAGGLFLSKEKLGQSGSGILVPYPDGAIFSNRPATGESEMAAVSTTYNGSISISDADGTHILMSRPTFEFLATPQVQYTPYVAAAGTTAAQTERLPQFNKDAAYQPFEPMVVISGRKDTKLNIVQGVGDKSNIQGATGTQNVVVFHMLGLSVRNMSELYSNKLASFQS